MTSAQLTTADGHVLAGDLAVPEGTVRGAAVVCHPHPQYGGNRFNPVVDAVYSRLPRAGYAALRFDFRQVFGGGVAERADVVAALDAFDAIPELAGVPRIVVGYSFGAVVALTTDDDRIAAMAAVAPPLAVMPASDPGRPTLVLTPRHDQFSPPDTTEPIVADWADATFAVVESADHFLAGRTDVVADDVVAWLGTLFPRPPHGGPS